MQSHTFERNSDMVSTARYNADERTLFLTFRSGNTTIAYRNVSPALYDELCRSPYPDVCIRFKIQADHSFRRVGDSYSALDYKFIK